MNPFQSLRDYEQFIYTLPQQFPDITGSTLIIAQRGRHFAELTGQVTLASRHRLAVYERLTWQRGPLIIEAYSYEVWQQGEKTSWYDSQPHPEDPNLASTQPHHQHVPPNIKHHRIPAPDLSFDQPNLPFLLTELEASSPVPRVPLR